MPVPDVPGIRLHLADDVTHTWRQAGAVLRYRLAPDSAHRPALFLRTALVADKSHIPIGATKIVFRIVPGVTA